MYLDCRYLRSEILSSPKVGPMPGNRTKVKQNTQRKFRVSTTVCITKDIRFRLRYPLRDLPSFPNILHSLESKVLENSPHPQGRRVIIHSLTMQSSSNRRSKLRQSTRNLLSTCHNEASVHLCYCKRALGTSSQNWAFSFLVLQLAGGRRLS